jgi:predicted transcriptional regulator
MEKTLKQFSSYELSERLAALNESAGTLRNYSHVFDNTDSIVEMINKEISNICAELDERDSVVSALVTLSIGTKIKSEVKQFRDDKHLDNYLTFMVKKGYKVMGVTTNV